ncbi:MAG: hypothetical protein CMH83_08125 [Nocardioides sp.]|nr:hypothetical protein [Nocardioides sp.]
MKIGFLVLNLDGMGGTSRSVVTQASALAPHHDVTVVSVTRSADRPHYRLHPRVQVRYVVDVRDGDHPAYDGVGPRTAASLHARESALVPRRWDHQFSALTDVGLEALLPSLDVDVLVTVTPGLLAAAVGLLPRDVAVVHQEHRSSNDRTSGLEPLLAFAPRADVVALLTPTQETWLREQLGDLAPPTVVLPNPLPLDFAPRSTLDEPLIVSAGRLVPEKQFPKLVDAFGQVADALPGWRLRILGEGAQRLELQRQVRKWNLWDRVELPGAVPDMGAEWARASVAALTSRAEGFPLVLQEAMAAGVPVASFDCPTGPREIVEHDVNGLLVGPQSVQGMAAALQRLATDDDLRHRLGTGALHTARQWDPHRLAERWTGVLADARARRAGRGALTARAHAEPVALAEAPTPPGADGAGTTPAEARTAALTCATEAARRATDTWLVVPAHERATATGPSVVVPMTARDAYLAALADVDAPAYLSLRDPDENGWPERRGPLGVAGAAPGGLLVDLRRGATSVLHVEPWPEVDGAATLLGQGCSVTVEFWETAPDGSLLAPRRNPYTERLAAPLETVDAEVDGVAVPSLPLMVAPTATECRFEVDVVLTWVDGSDPAWDDAREARLAALTGATARTRESSGRARYLDRGELRYGLRSLHLFAPWVRRIHLVTAGQVPSWLDTEHPGIHVVDHRDLLPDDALPTFNSHAIETSLHRIEGLAEHFVYLNDDFMLGRPIGPEALFTPGGQTSVFFSPTTVGLTDSPDAPPFLKAAWNNRQLLYRTFGSALTSNLAHAPYAHRVSVLSELWERFHDELAATARSPFRSDTDVATLSSLAQHYGLQTGTAYVGEADLAYVNISNSDLEWQLNRLLDRDQDFICLGDHHDHALRADRLQQVLAEFLEAYYPVPAPWERAD